MARSFRALKSVEFEALLPWSRLSTPDNYQQRTDSRTSTYTHYMYRYVKTPSLLSSSTTRRALPTWQLALHPPTRIVSRVRARLLVPALCQICPSFHKQAPAARQRLGQIDPGLEPPTWPNVSGTGLYAPTITPVNQSMH